MRACMISLVLNAFKLEVSWHLGGSELSKRPGYTFFFSLLSMFGRSDGWGELVFTSSTSDVYFG